MLTRTEMPEAFTACRGVNLSVQQATNVDYERISAFIETRPDCVIFQHPGWVRALALESGGSCLTLVCNDEQGKICGILPLLTTRGLPFNVGKHNTRRRVSSLPRTPIASIVAENDGIGTLLLIAAIGDAQQQSAQLEVKTWTALPPAAELNLKRDTWRPTYRLTLPKSSDQLTFGNARSRHNLKWGIKKARNVGLEIRSANAEAELRTWYRLYLQVMRRNSVLPRPYRFFAALWKEFVQSGKLRLLLAGHDGEVVAGSIFLMAGQTVFYAFTGCSDNALVSHANDLIVWTAIESACREGYRYFDFGEVAEEHPELVRFKTKWGAEPVPQYRYYYPASSDGGGEGRVAGAIRERVRTVWPRLPLRLTEIAGDLLTRFL